MSPSEFWDSLGPNCGKQLKKGRPENDKPGIPGACIAFHTPQHPEIGRGFTLAWRPFPAGKPAEKVIGAPAGVR